MPGALSPLAPAPAGPLLGLGLGLGLGAPAVPGALSPLTPAPAGPLLGLGPCLGLGLGSWSWVLGLVTALPRQQPPASEPLISVWLRDGHPRPLPPIPMAAELKFLFSLYRNLRTLERS